MTFREKLHNDLDGISPSDELLSRVSQMMAEEAEKPKQPIYLNVAKWGAMAAAVCLIAVGAVSFFGKGSESTTPDIAVADASGYSLERDYAEDSAITEEENTSDDEEYTFGHLNFDLDPSTIQLNETPDLSAKSIPEDYNDTDYLVPEKLSDLVNSDSDIVIVKITDSSEYAGNSFSGEADIYYAQAEAVVKSEIFLKGDIIPVLATRSSVEARLETGKCYLLVTEEFESGIFKIYSGRESVFEITNDNTVISQSHLKVPSMLDGLTVEEAASLLKHEQDLKK